MSGLVSGDPDVPGQVFVSDLYSAQCLLLPDDSWGAGAVVTCLQITCDEMAGAGHQSWWDVCSAQHYTITCYLIKARPAAGANPIPPALLPGPHLPPPEWQHAANIISDNVSVQEPLVSRLCRRSIARLHSDPVKSWKLCPLACAGGRNIIGLEPIWTYFHTKSCRFSHISPSCWYPGLF